MIIAPRVDPDALRMPARDILLYRCFLAAAFALALPAAGAADMGKTLHAEFRIAESSFDPAAAWDAASDAVIEHILDPMPGYEYLARPVKLQPNTLQRLPETSRASRAS